MSGENDKWEFYTDKRGEYRWRRTASNGEIVGASCEGYTSKSYAISNAKRHGMDGNPENLGSKDKWEIYQDKRGEYRWRRIASNGEITGASSESYLKEEHIVENAKRNGMQ